MKVGVGVGAAIFVNAVWPALIEQLVSPQPSKPDDSWGKKAAKSMLYTEGATMPFFRDVMEYALGGEPQVGLGVTEIKQLQVIRDLFKKEPFAPAHWEKMIRDAFGFMGALTGSPDQAGKLVGAGYGLATGVEHPQGPWGWLTLGIHGTIKGHAPTFNDWMAGRSLPNR
jgi:hypothetical protein